MNEEFQSKLRAIIKSALDDFADQQVNIASENARDAIAFRVATDIVDNFSSKMISDEKQRVDEYTRAVLRHYIF